VVLASADSFGYRLFFLLHILSVVVAFAPAFVWPILNRQARVSAQASADGEGGVVVAPPPALTGVMNPFVHGSAVVLAGLFGFGLVGMSSDAWKFSQTWVSLGMLLWFIMIAVVFVGLVPAQRALREAKADAEQRLAMLYGALHLLLLLQLIDMIWKPGL
jgi:hypothetical protein